MSPVQPSAISASSSGVRWFWGIGVAIVVFAARLREIELHSGSAPYLDQWRVEGQQILLPWLQGDLSISSFFAPHHEHVPVWTRILAWLQAAWLGRWDPQLQTTINAALFGGFSGLLASWLRRNSPLPAALGLTLLVVALGALPFGWENSTWGFQSHVPLALGFVFLHVTGSFHFPPFSPAWWWAQAAGVACLFTFGSMWAAPAAVAATVFWSSSHDRRRWLTPALIAVAGLILLLAVRTHQPPGAAVSLAANSPQDFISALLLHLGWPVEWPGACVLLNLPAFLVALKLRRGGDATSIDKIVVALAVFAAAQAAAFAYARGGGYLGFVSRYGDLLSLGLLANGVGLARLVTGARSWRPVLGLLAIAWVGAVFYGLNWVSTRGHTEYFHAHSAEWKSLRQDAVRQYLETRDIGTLASEPVRNLLYPDPAAVAAVLDQPGLSALLPVGLRSDSQPVRGDFVSAIAAGVRSQWQVLGWGGGVLFLVAIVSASRGLKPVLPAPLVAGPVFRWQSLLLAAIALGAGGLLFLWPKPLEFSFANRLKPLLTPPGTVTDLSFRIITATNYPKDNLTGGASLWPEDFRNQFYGTHIDGPAFTGTAESSVFPLNSPWLVLPLAGFPASSGNALRVQIENGAGAALATFDYSGPNPAVIGFWAIDVRTYQGKSARIILTDGRNDNEGWVATGPPQPANRPEAAQDHARAWSYERTRSGHDSLAVLAGMALFLSVLTAIQTRKKLL